MKIISCNSNHPLSEDIANYLGTSLCKASIRRFADHEIFVEVLENIRGEDVFVIQSTSYPANDHLMELLITIDALKRASARRITAVIPYFGYARQDRKTGPRTPISAKLVANLIAAAGATRVLTLELHAGQIQGFFDIPLDNLIISPVFIPHIEESIHAKHKNAQIALASPDVGGVVRTRAFAKRLGAELVIIDKRRERAGASEVMHVIGDVKDRVCVLIDDMVDSGGTLVNAAQALKEHGAKDVFAYTVHGVLSGEAVPRISDSAISELVITDSIAATEAVKREPKIQRLSVAALMGEAIKRIAEERSVSVLFK